MEVERSFNRTNNSMIIITDILTKANYDRLMRMLEKKGYEWANGQKPTEFDAWEGCKEEVAILLGEFLNEVGNKKITWGRKSFYQQEPNYKDANFITYHDYLVIVGTGQKFKAGDRVRIKSKSVEGYSDWKEIKEKYKYPNDIGYVTKIYGDGSGRDGKNCLVVDKRPDSDSGNYFAPHDLELIEETNNQGSEGTGYTTTYTVAFVPAKPEPTKMQKLTPKLRRMFNANLRIQYQAGYIDECNDLTEKGQEVLNILQREALDEQLTEEARKDLEEMKKEEK